MDAKKCDACERYVDNDMMSSTPGRTFSLAQKRWFGGTSYKVMDACTQCCEKLLKIMRDPSVIAEPR